MRGADEMGRENPLSCLHRLGSNPHPCPLLIVIEIQNVPIMNYDHYGILSNLCIKSPHMCSMPWACLYEILLREDGDLYYKLSLP